MGCASSNPLIESGKNLVESAKESAVDFAHKGEHAIQEAGETAKDGVTTGAHNVKSAVESAVEKVGNNITSSVDKISETFKTKHEESEEAFSTTIEDATNKTNENMMEVVSEAETVLASEVEHIMDDVHETTTKTEDLAFDKVNTFKSNILEEARQLHKAVDDHLEVQDVESVPVNTVEITSDSVTATIFTPPEEDTKE